MASTAAVEATAGVGILGESRGGQRELKSELWSEPQAYGGGGSREAGAEVAPGMPPWSQRRLNDALAELGPVRPVSPAPAKPELPPPPAVALTSSPIIQGNPAPDVLADLGPIALAEGDTAGREIVMALAAAGGPEAIAPAIDTPAAAPAAAEPLGEAAERPPMIIERARLEQELGLNEVSSSRPSPWPGLTLGALLSLVAGTALYQVLAAG